MRYLIVSFGFNFNILKEAKLNNIDEKRLIFAKRVKIQEHLKRLKLADIFLDTFPYGAHTRFY